MNDFSNVVKLVMKFGVEHSMIEEVVFLSTPERVADHSFKETGLYIVPDTADITRREGSPIYTLRFLVGVVQKFSTRDIETELNAHSTALFVLGELNDYLLQNLPSSSDADISNAAFDGLANSNDGGSVCFLDGSLEIELPRAPYNRTLALDD